MQSQTLQEQQTSFALSVPEGYARGCSPYVRMHLDHLLMAIECLDLEAMDVMLYFIQQLKLEAVIPNRVTFWRIRNSNPLRRNYQRGAMGWDEARALTRVICAVARAINTPLRLLTITCQQVEENKVDMLGLQQDRARLDQFVDRFRSMFLARMRSPSVLSDAEIKDLFVQLIVQLFFCGGTGAEIRLWQSLFRGV